MGKQEIQKKLKETHDPYLVINQLFAQHPQIKEKINQLKELKRTLQAHNLIQQVKLSKRSTLSGLLNEKGNKLVFDNNDKKEEQLIVDSIFQGYHLTSEILQEIGFIDKVTYTYAYIDSKGDFHRAGDMHLDVSSVKLEAASKGRGQSLRMQSSIIKAQIAAKSIDSEKDAMINLHFQKFAKPFFDYAEHNNTGQKINTGVLMEAFERHQENMHHSLQEGGTTQFNRNSIGNDLESKGTRQRMYRQSSGSAAYYTGPDTLYAQVKNANASLIDNVNTVLNTMDALIQLFDNTISTENLVEKLQRAFIASPDGENIATKIQDGISEQEQEEILKEIAEDYKAKLNDINIIRKKNKVIFEITTKINT